MGYLTQNGRLRPAVLIALFALLLALPSVVNGKPFLFYDSTHYYDVGKAIADKVEGVLMPGAAAEVEPETPAAETSEKSGPAITRDRGDGALAAISGGRSPIYSLLTYLLSVVFSTYGIVALQSLVCAFVIHRLLRVFAPGASALSQTALVAVLAILTPLGFHAGFVMPDIFAGVFVVTALILIFDKTLRLPEQIGLTALLAFAATMHTTIVAIGLVMITLVLIARYFLSLRPSVNAQAAPAIAAALVLCVGFGAAYKTGVETVTGNEIRNAPYLAGRVIADGPGKRYLQEKCDNNPFAVCQFSGVDYIDHNDFLWGGFGAARNWSTASPEIKAAIQDEEKDFVLAVIAAYPVSELKATIGNAWLQLTYFGIRETASGAEVMMTYSEFGDNALMAHVPNLEGCAEGRNCEGVNPLREAWAVLVHTSLLVMTVILIGLIALNARRVFARGAQIDEGMKTILIASGFVIIVLLANAAVCGALSGPHDRYQARIAWIVTLMLGAGILHWKNMQAHEPAA